MERLRQTPSQTVGPFFAYSLTAVQYGYAYDSIANHTLIGPDTPGERIFITGRILDGQGNPVPDAIIEIWQADSEGNYRTAPISAADHDSHEFIGFGRLGTGTQPGAVFRFDTIKPGRVRSGRVRSGRVRSGSVTPGAAPHINITLFMRGSLRALYTRLYFADEAAANEQDSLLAMIPTDRRTTLIATAVQSAAGPGYHLDIHLQGDQETVFFDL
ncbi:protocatechuate 3,4-dioxygenase subunit alpha [Fibrella forsythiae]|uniref:Protocatechuate 3,4-dioxygenase subunit alpha n=1 Tax=Fibrella forsythiae TaxID=2817061 RepID=A0ABS3JPL4_9BACT|nr:protocatechuate 3,4-dioxygenase subunit alpha [Fibrella forsythiae]MBO0951935.1 protocatechuate 3,4-dioxygenase subunit alpha [Fibrella forsythiae]